MSQSWTSEPPAAWWTPRTTIRPTEEDLPSEARPYKQYCTTVRTSVKAEATLIGSGLRPPGTSSTAGDSSWSTGQPPRLAAGSTNHQLLWEEPKNRCLDLSSKQNLHCWAQQSSAGPSQLDWATTGQPARLTSHQDLLVELGDKNLVS